MADRLVVAVEGSTRRCSAALLRMQLGAKPDGDPWITVARRMEIGAGQQSRALLSFVDEMLEETGRTPVDLAAVVVGTGPGTFTGVRIAVATARALGLALSVPVLGVGSLGALAARAAEAGVGVRRSVSGGQSSPSRSDNTYANRPEGWIGIDTLVAVVDARRGQVFYASYRLGSVSTALAGARWKRTTGFGVCDAGTLGQVVQTLRQDRKPAGTQRGRGIGAETALIVGERSVVGGDLPAGCTFADIELCADWLVRGQHRLEEPGPLPQGERLSPWLEEIVVGRRDGVDWADVVGGTGTPESVTPEYVRSPDADVHIAKMRDPWANASDAG